MHTQFAFTCMVTSLIFAKSEVRCRPECLVVGARARASFMTRGRTPSDPPRARPVITQPLMAMATAAINPDKRNRHKSLSSLLRFFEGTELTVETKKGKLFSGILSSSDEAMNLQLDDCTVSNQETRLLQVHIRGSTIRYIHFPNHTDLSGVIRSGIDRERAAANKYKRGLRKSK